MALDDGYLPTSPPVTQGRLPVTKSEIALADGSFEVVGLAPIPEPTTIFGAIALVGLIGYRERRRLLGVAGALTAKLS